MSMNGELKNIIVSLHDVLTKSDIEKIQSNKKCQLEEIHGNSKVRELLDLGIFTLKPEAKFSYQFISDPGNCGAMFMYNGSMSLFSDVNDLGTLSIETNQKIANIISNEIIRHAHSFGKSLIHCTDVIYLASFKSNNFPTRFMYLAAFAPEYWTVHTSGAVNNRNYDRFSKAIATLTCRHPDKDTNHCETSIVKLRENPYFQNVNVTK